MQQLLVDAGATDRSRSISYVPTSLPVLSYTVRLLIVLSRCSSCFDDCILRHAYSASRPTSCSACPRRIPAVGARNRTADQQQVFSVSTPTTFRLAPCSARPVAASHPTTLENAGRERIATGRAGVTMYLLHAVRGTLATEAVALHDAGGAATLGDAGDVDGLDVAEEIDLQLLADRALRWTAKFADRNGRLAIGLGGQFHAGRRETLGALLSSWAT